MGDLFNIPGGKDTASSTFYIALELWFEKSDDFRLDHVRLEKVLNLTISNNVEAPNFSINLITQT